MPTAKPKRPIKTAPATEPELPEAVVTSKGGKVTTVVTSTGSNALGRPVFMEPTSPHAVTNNLVCRDQIDPQEPLEPLSPTITGLRDTVKAMSMGHDIGPHKEHIQQIAANQPEKGDVVRAYINQANHELIADLVEMRHNSIRHIKRAARRNDVSVSEALVVWRMCNDQLPDLTRGLSENDKAVDTLTVVEKIDYHRQQVERSVQEKWQGTTPQGREIIRKKLWEIRRQMLAARGVHPPSVEIPSEEPEAEEEVEQNPA